MTNIDNLMKESLLKRAQGYEYEEKEVILNAKSGKPEKVKVVKRHMPPDMKAIEQLIRLINAGGIGEEVIDADQKSGGVCTGVDNRKEPTRSI